MRVENHFFCLPLIPHLFLSCFLYLNFFSVDFIRIDYISLLRSPIRSGYGSWSGPEKNGINLWVSSLKLCNDGRKRTCFGVNSDFYIRFTCHFVLILCGYLWVSNGCFLLSFRSFFYIKVYASMIFYSFLHASIAEYIHLMIFMYVGWLLFQKDLVSIYCLWVLLYGKN